MQRRAATWTDLIEQLYESAWNGDLQRFRSPYAFRGHSCAGQGLINSLARLADGKVDVERLELSLLRNFRKYAHSSAVNGVESIWHWLAVAQHHGLPTRLIDWTKLDQANINERILLPGSRRAQPLARPLLPAARLTPILQRITA